MPPLPGALGSGRLYCEATHGPDEVLCYGSDDDYYESAAARVRCLEKQARRFLDGRPPFLLSASLRGPFDKGLWDNPWKGRGSRPQRRRRVTPAQTPAPQPAPASIQELGTTPDANAQPVPKKRAVSADWLRRTNLKRMRSCDSAPTTVMPPTVSRGLGGNASRSISAPADVDDTAMDEDEGTLSKRCRSLDPCIKMAVSTGKRKSVVDKQSRKAAPCISDSIDRPMSDLLDVQQQHSPTTLCQEHNILSPELVAMDGPTDAENQQQNDSARHTEQATKAESEATGVLTIANCSASPITESRPTPQLETDMPEDMPENDALLSRLSARSMARTSTTPTCSDEMPGTPNLLPERMADPLLPGDSLLVEEYNTDEASQQLLGEFNHTNGAVNVKKETDDGEILSQIQPHIPDAEPDVSSGDSSDAGSGADSNADDNTSVDDTTITTWETDPDSLLEDVNVLCDNNSAENKDRLKEVKVENCGSELPETAPLRLSLETAEQVMLLDESPRVESVGTSISSSLSNLPTSPCSPDHYQESGVFKPMDVVQELVPAIRSSSIVPSTPDTKQSSLPTPDMSVSIKSFRRFRSPTPTPPPRRRANKPGQLRSILSHPRRKAGVFPGSSRRGQRVRFELPDDDADKEADGVPFTYTYDLQDADMEDKEEEETFIGPAERSQIQCQGPRTASPPPRDGALAGALPTEVEKFQDHFASVASRAKGWEHRTSNQQRRSVAAAPGLAGASSPLQEQRTSWQSPAAAVRLESKASNEAASGADKENQTGNKEAGQFGEGDEEEDDSPVDDVQDVLDNLDDFLGIWNIEEELAQVRAERM